ncbi:Aspartokinase 1 [Arabidopsis thaliana]|uniref:Aspartokinase 1, chloroplastic n=4 Tax=Arabidopsis TaxID=3701 RepID=AK1_ARATH|nr:aspartate kinase 1 [Arabidopsis thaliana]Q9LYU8.1 RecName: Full=Aspartokinase 1, chloroplastic; AltName: Full=Aspartate kinase 1; Flags: Precursor [Arabidopsis thaliana]KAG7602100.1 Aspartate/glutamate/uridylate kinase [Arabidopsis thaliana x Arabidopsis arenosa]KAG7609049.1 Aspartate/glutamate/uridylate kinase [Arabidopsis suecica]AAL15305.1 AT5g13280/T31B5_100 [Arabidopsis thaliana]AAN18062.1 At5g13280/T31B5_100 [Arabidopsis thaliana]AED91874.1 aspartate kinase 1 [Arabidopsis thaliana]|eukprot:NP_196832.1 aspartate kinase 1 [Arabidopsis thaliana]
MAATRVRCCHSNAAFTRLPLTRHRNSPTLPISLNRVDFPTLKKLSLPIGDGSSIRKVSGSGSRNIVRAVLEEKKTEAITEVDEKGITCVMKFGGSSVASAERMKEVADLILTFPEESPVIVLSAMGKTTNNLLLAGEKAVSCGVSNASEIEELSIIKELHIRTVKELNIDPSVILTYLEELEQLLKGIAMMKELTLRTRDYLVSFGECLSTRIFAAYLNTIGVKARQYDAFEIGFITTDDFTNGDILEATYPAVAKRLYDDWMHDPAVPIVTGFLGKGWKTGAVTTLGRGGSDLTATTIGKALGLKEIQVWKDVDGVLTCDPTIYKRATPVPYLTFDEAAELAYFGAQVLHPQSMRPAREGEIPVRVKNSYNPKAPGTIITKTRDMTKSILTSIVLKRNVTMLDIASTRMLGQVGFLAKVFSIFEELGISVDVVATSEVSISLTLDPSKLWSRELIQQELDHVVEELEKIAVVNLLKGRAIISLIGNVQHSSLILERAFHVLYTKGVNVQMISQGASKVNISFIVNEAEAEGCVQALHKSFFESGDLSELLIQPRLGNGSPVRTLQVEN